MAADKGKQFTAWTITVLLAFWMLFAGVPKLWGGLGWAARFSEWGYPPWMVFLTGLAEISGAILILIPRTAVFGGGILSMVMLGAMLTQLIFNGVGQAVAPLIAIVMAGVIVGMRWQESIIAGQKAGDTPHIVHHPNT